jgi:hypothetical protein
MFSCGQVPSSESRRIEFRKTLCEENIPNRSRLLLRAAVRYRPVYHLEMTPISRKKERTPVPWASVRSRPLQQLEVPAPRRPSARLLVPRAAVRAHPL